MIMYGRSGKACKKFPVLRRSAVCWATHTDNKGFLPWTLFMSEVDFPNNMLQHPI